MFEPCAPDRQLTGGPSGVVVTPPPLGVLPAVFVVMHSVPVYCLVLKPAGLVLPVFTSWHCLHRPRPNFGSLGLSRMSMSSVLSYG